MEQQEKKLSFSITALSVTAKSTKRCKTMSKEAIKEENRKLGETRTERDRIWSSLANQVIGAEHIRE